jgi:hypothetical protein
MTGWNYVGGRVDLLGGVISVTEGQRKYNNLERGEHAGILNRYINFAVKRKYL